ncbi:MAG: DUF998 domain-containing protein [Actinomycetota bacterium]|nr:DUF998 domain-containing protein [Actinomycetota bacterium]
MSNDSNPLIVSYLILRKFIGALGVGLPVVLPIGVAVLGSRAVLQPSISHYVGTIMRGVFVGVLFAIGVFLFSYVGYGPWDGKRRYEPGDNVAGNVASVFALGVALFPTNSGNDLVRSLHFLSAAALFIALAYISIHLFTKTGETTTDQKRRRNKLYRVCGWFMIGCIVAIAIYNWFLQDTRLADIKPVFWLEALALWAFGWAWFVKGKGLGLLND